MTTRDNRIRIAILTFAMASAFFLGFAARAENAPENSSRHRCTLHHSGCASAGDLCQEILNNPWGPLATDAIEFGAVN